jgi:hypothetical protein
VTLYPRALVLTNFHPYGGTEMMARSLAAALELNGYDASVVNINTDGPERLNDPDLALTISTGALPLEMRYWPLLPNVTHIAYVIDAWPYDYVRVPGFREFYEDAHTNLNLKLACLEKNNADLIGAYYMPSGPYPAPRIVGPKQYPDCLLMWGSVGAELAVTPLHDGLEATIADNNPWGLSPSRIKAAAEALQATKHTHGLTAIADAINGDVDALLAPHVMPATCAIDSCLKRWRRVKVARALADFPLDIYGKGWERFGLKCQTPQPDHNHAFGHIVQNYGGFVNVDPNFGYGTNERVMTALAMGIRTATNVNARTDWIDGACPYSFDDASIQAAAQRALLPTPIATLHDCSWEDGVRGLLEWLK